MPGVADRHREEVSRRGRESLRVVTLSRSPTPDPFICTPLSAAWPGRIRARATGPPLVVPARPDRHPPLRAPGLAHARPVGRAPGLRLRRPRPRRVLPAARRPLRLPRAGRGPGGACWTSSASTAAVLAGSSMGAATAMAFALANPAACDALVQITPAYDGQARTGTAALEAWDARADALAAGDIDAFVELTGVDALPERFRDSARTAVRQRAERHEHPEAVAEAAAPGPPVGGLRRPRPAGLGRRARPRGRQPRRHRPRAPACGRARVRRRLPNAELVVEERGRGAAGVAGGAAVEGDRRRSWPASRRAPSPPARSSRPPRPPPGSPGSSPSTAAVDRARPASSASAAKCRRLSSARSVNGGMVDRPVTGTGQRAMKSPSSAGTMPSLPSSPATLTCTSTSGAGLVSSLRRTESDATEWISRTCGRHVLDLAALQLADEVPGEQVGVGRALVHQLLGAVHAHQLDSGLGQHRQLVGAHVLDRRQHGHAVADPLAHALEVAPHSVDLEPGERPPHVSHTSPAWRPVIPWSRRWEKNRSSRS